LVGIRYLLVHGVSAAQVRPARRLLLFASSVTLALNVTDPVITGQFGKAAFDAVGPVLLLGRAEVGPGFLGAITAVSGSAIDCSAPVRGQVDASVDTTGVRSDRGVASGCGPAPRRWGEDLVDWARREDERHRQTCLRPISAETLRKRMRIGASRSRQLVDVVRSELRDGITEVAGVEDRAAGPMTADLKL
jgi:hypothetical protein